MNIFGKPGISFGSITYRRKYNPVLRINFFFSSSSSAFAKRTGSLSLLIIVSQKVKNKGVQEYISRTNEKGRKERRHSSFFVG
ncbi:MAG: hypothetical protein O4859_08925, partial [Trichodesmium sp. St18_bin1]|nr:hypothetical protein [Trichodesmium sp. St18_bin1]